MPYQITLPKRLSELRFQDTEYLGRTVNGSWCVQLPLNPESQNGILIAGEAVREVGFDVGKCFDSGWRYLIRSWTGIRIENPSFAPDAWCVQAWVPDDIGPVARIDEGMNKLRMLRDELLITRQKRPDQVNGVYLPDDSRPFTRTAKVLEVGPHVTDIVPGDVILVRESLDSFAELGACDDFAQWYGYDADSFAIISAAQVAVLEV